MTANGYSCLEVLVKLCCYCKPFRPSIMLVIEAFSNWLIPLSLSSIQLHCKPYLDLLVKLFLMAYYLEKFFYLTI